MPRLHLTDIAVRALKVPASGQVGYWDAATRGFGVRVSQAGTKTFVAKVHNRRVTIGRYPEVSLADARRKADGVKSETQPVDDRPLSGWSKYKSKMTDGVPGWTMHDLRRTFATRLAELKVAPHVVERLLNHKMGGITNKTDGIVSAVAEVYNRAAYLPEMREAIALWEQHLASLIAEGGRSSGLRAA